MKASVAGNSDPNKGFLWRLHKPVLYGLVLYVLLIIALLVPQIQRHVAYQHTLSLPLFADFDAPHQFGLAPLKTRNLKIQTPDGIKLGAWYITFDSFYHATGGTRRKTPPTLEEISLSLKLRPTFLSLHGSLGSRAMNYRVQMYSQLTSGLDANVLAIDYRGFGDSTGYPSEQGLYTDVRTAWDWLVELGADPSNIVVLGHSLGTGPSAKLVSTLEADGIQPRALVLLTPYLSVMRLLDTFDLFGIPLLWPIQLSPTLTRWFASLIPTKFSTIDLIGGIKSKTLIVHAKDDTNVPFFHAEELFTAAVTGFGNSISEKKIGTEIEPFGSIKTAVDSESGRTAVFFVLEQGGHQEIIRWEGVIDVVGDITNVTKEVEATK